MVGEQLNPDGWKGRQAECCAAWRLMSRDEREKFEAEAASEQELRDEFAQMLGVQSSQSFR